MNDLEKIIEILDKDFISEKDKSLLIDLVNANPEGKKIQDAYLNLKNSLRRDEHIDEELMAEYVMYKNNLSSGKLIILLSNKIEDHIRQCIQCEMLFKDLNAEYCDIDSYVSQSFSNKTGQEKKFFSLEKFSAVKYAFASLAAVVVLYIGLFAVSSVLTPDYKKSFFDDNDYYTTRGRTSELFQRGLDAIDKKEYDKAIEFLNKDISDNSSDESIFYNYFIIGVTYLNKSESDFIGLFKSFNKEDVENAISNFEKSIELNNSGKFDNLNLDAHYFIGKSYLMIDNLLSAKKHLQIVVDGKGSYYKNAKAALDEL